MPITNYPYGVSSFGIPLIGSGPILATGDVFFVDSVSGTDSGGSDGTNLRPFATLDYAIGRCTANNGDVIFLKENHAETLAAADAVNVDIAGIKIVGLGVGDDRPTFTFATATAADVEIAAANTEIVNCVFICNIASQTRMITLGASADGANIHHNEFREGTATGLSMIEWTDVADDVRVEDNVFYAPTAGNYDEAILIASTPTRGHIKRNLIYGDWDEGGINNAAANVATLFEISDNDVVNLQAGIGAIVLVSAVTGVMSDNRVATSAITASIDPGSMRCNGNLWTGAAGTDQAGVPVPTPLADINAGDTLMGVLQGTGGLVAFPAAAIPAAGVSLAEVIRQLYAALEGTAASQNGVATWPTAAAYASNVSIAEVLGYIQDGVRNTTGTALAAGESLADVLYATNGILTFPAAALPANGVSIAEVLREAYNQQEKAVSTAAAVLANGTATIFTVAGGPIEVVELLSVCVTGNDATASTLQYAADPTDGAQTTVSGASASLTSATAGTVVLCTGTFATAASVNANGTVAAGTTKFIVPAGVVQAVVATGPSTGTWTHHLRYKPLARGVTVT